VRFLTSLVAALILIAAGLVAFAYSGLYDVGADAAHSAPVAWFLGTLRARSLAADANGVASRDLNDPKLIAEGAEHYDAMCTGCHLAPGMEDTELRKGLYPQPPKLADPWPSDPREQFWAIKHGIKFTAMPAWGATHDDDTIWAIVAFLQKLQGMTPEQYAQATGHSAEEHEGHHHHHDEEDHPS
jgi:mono/diheme cytochrome c family protein